MNDEEKNSFSRNRGYTITPKLQITELLRDIHICDTADYWNRKLFRALRGGASR
jgi:hypothetical protein